MIICANFAKKVNLNDIFKKASEIGFKNIQFSLVHFGINDDNPEIDDSFLDKAKEIKQNAMRFGISFPVIHGWLPSEYSSAKRTFDIYSGILRILGSKYIVFHPKSLEHLRTIIKCINDSSDKNVYLIENVAEENFMMKYDDIDLISKNNINMCFDTCHALENGLDVYEYLEKYKKSIRMMHLSDFDGVTRHAVIGLSKITPEFVNKIPKDMIIVFEHKAKTVEDYTKAYSESFKYLNKILM